MRITGWYIDGFGHFAGEERSAVGRGLTVVHGPNEAGKTTLLAFIRHLLFGFPHGRSNQPSFAPQRGGQHGGRLFLEAADETFVLTRFNGANGGEPSVTANDGRRVALGDLIGVADRAVFESVFAFGIDELHEFSTLQGEAVRERIFSGGILGTGQSTQDVMRKLEGRQKALFAPRARDARIATLRATLAQLRSSLARSVEASRGYGAVLGEEERLVKSAAVLAEEIVAADRRAGDLETLLAVWNDWYDASIVAKELASLPLLDAVPADASVHLMRLTSGVTAQEKRLADARQVRDDTAAGLTRLAPVDEVALRLEPELLAARDALALAKDWHEKRALAASRVTSCEQALKEQLVSLGAGWDAARVMTFDRSVARVDEVRRLDNAMKERRRDVDQREQEARRKQDACDVEQRVCEGKEIELDQLPDVDGAHLDTRATLIASVATRLNDRERTKTALESDERALGDAQQALEEASQGAEARRLAGLRWVIIGVGVLLAAYGVWRTTQGESSSIVMIVLGLLLTGGALAMARAKPTGDPGVKARVERARASRDERKREFDRLVAEIMEGARKLGMEYSPSPEELELLRQGLSDERSVLQQRKQVRLELERARQSLAVAGQQLEKALDGLTTARQHLSDAESEWSRWRSAAAIPGELSSDGALDFIGAVREAQETVRTRDAASKEVTALGANLEDFLGRVAAIAERIGTGRPTDVAAAGSLLERGRLQCEQAAKLRDEKRLLQSELEKNDAALASADQDLATAHAALNIFLTDVGASNVAELEEMIEQIIKREGLTTRHVDHERAVALRLGSGPRADALRAELQSADPDGWSRERNQLSEARERLGQERDRAIGARQDASNARRALEQAADVPRLALEIEQCESQLASAVREWRTLAAARELVARTLTRFERERQPAVIARAGELFATVTKGTYPRLRQGDGEIVVVDEVAGERDSSLLSRGTREQLYLCVRLGLCHELAQRRTRLPLVMDDVLVNFDGERAEAVGRLLVEVAREQQVLLFTCHEHVRDMLAALDSSVTVLELPRYAGKARPASVSMKRSRREMARADVVPLVSANAREQEPSEAAQAILEVLTASDQPLGKRALLEQSAVEEGEWGRAIGELLYRGLVTSEGQKRATIYRAAEMERGVDGAEAVGDGVVP